MRSRGIVIHSSVHSLINILFLEKVIHRENLHLIYFTNTTNKNYLLIFKNNNLINISKRKKPLQNTSLNTPYNTLDN